MGLSPGTASRPISFRLVVLSPTSLFTIAGVALPALTLVALSGLLGDVTTRTLDDLNHLAAGAVAGVCLLLTRLRVQGEERLWRLLLTCGATAWTAGQLVWAYHRLMNGQAPPSPSLADAGRLALPLFALPALWLVPPRGRRPRSWPIFGVDLLIAFGALFIMIWATPLGNPLRAPGPGFGGLVTDAYLASGLLIIALVLLLARFRIPADPWRWTLIALGLVAFAVSEALLLGLFHPAHGSTAIVDGPRQVASGAGFVFGPLLLAGAALTGAGRTEEASEVGSDCAFPALARRPQLPGLSWLPWLPPAGAALIVAGQLAAGRPLGVVGTGVGLGLLVAILLRQSLTGLDNVRLIHELRAGQEQLRAQAYNDSLTGLANRALFDQRLRRAIRGGRPLGLIFCDLDDFKAVNDQLGHNAGDDVLRAVAHRLRGCVRPADTVARLGGDEFAILMEDAAEAPDVIGRRILGAVGRPFQLRHRGEEARVRVGASVGVAVLDRVDPDASPESLLAGVDQAMYAAKRRGKNQLVTFRNGAGPGTGPGAPGADRYLPLFDPAVSAKSMHPTPPSHPTPHPTEPMPEGQTPTTGSLPVPPGVPQVIDHPLDHPPTGPIPRLGSRTTPGGLNTPAAQYRGSGQARPEPPRPEPTEAERKAEDKARLAAAAQRSVERTLAGFEALEKESERREAEQKAAERRAHEALEIEAEVRAGTRPEAEVIPLSRAVDIRTEKADRAEKAERAERARREAREAGQDQDEPEEEAGTGDAGVGNEATGNPPIEQAQDGRPAVAGSASNAESPDDAEVPEETRRDENSSPSIDYEGSDSSGHNARWSRAGATAEPDHRPSPIPPFSLEETVQQAEQLASLASDHIDVIYRPVLRPQTGQLVALATTVRWRHPVHGVLESAALMTAAEHAGLRRPLEERLLDSVCADLALLRKAPDWDELAAHVPLDARYLTDDRLVTVVERTLRRHDLPGSALVLRISGTGPSVDLVAAERVLGRVRALGVGIGLAGFGTGAAGLALLTRLPIGYLTLDESLTAAEPGSRATAVLAGVVAMTPGLALTLIADGVNHQEQADRLTRLGVELAQGPLYGPPVPLPELDLMRLPVNPTRS